MELYSLSRALNKMSMGSYRHIVLILLLPMISVLKLSAEEELLWLPDYFERVNSLAEIEDGAYYLIAGTSQQDGHVLMTSELVNKKLQGVVSPKQDRILCSDGALVWQIYRSGNEVILRAAQESKFLYVPQSNKPEVELQSDVYTSWELQQKDDGFVLKHTSESTRYLHTSHQMNAENCNPFGNYSFYEYEGRVETNVLYLYKLDVEYTPPSDNTITYLEPGEKVPATGNLIVRNGVLIYHSVLLDAEEFVPTQPFSVAEGQLSFTRILQDNNWETLSLPFPAHVPEGIDARELESAVSGELIFTPVTEIQANVPVILRCADVSGGSVTFVSKACTVSAPPMSTSLFQPSYTHLSVTSAAEHIYLLTSEGKTFSLADSGSKLRPFRAYVKLE